MGCIVIVVDVSLGVLQHVRRRLATIRSHKELLSLIDANVVVRGCSGRRESYVWTFCV